MANMMDYLAWRGDLSFRQSEFNEVDNLILAELVYVDFKGIVPGIKEEGSVTLDAASALFFERHTVNEIEKKVSSTKMAAFLMQEMAVTKRFGKMELFKYVDDINKEEESQFSVLMIRLDDESIYVSYSGTDNTMVGWKENFNMSFLTKTPGQLKAVEYLNQVIRPEYGTIRLGGHSKGGNLAVYAGVYCDAWIKDRIAAIYSNDGPGFSKAMISNEEYHKMLPIIHTTIPQSSIVGMLLEHEEAYSVVESSQSGPMQHDAMTWKVMGPSFVHVKSVAEESVFLDQTLKAWIGKMEVKQREEFVETLFAILDSADIQTIDDLATMKWKTFMELIKGKNSMDKENQEVLSKTMRMLWEESKRTHKNMKMYRKAEELKQK